jgi:hypothetical protein
MPGRDLCSADTLDRTIARGFSNHERTRMDTKKLSDSRPLVSIRGSFLSLLRILISGLCHTVYPLRYFIRVHLRPFVVQEFGLFPANRCLALRCLFYCH